MIPRVCVILFLFFSKVNAGPLAYAETFLDQEVVKNYMNKHIEALQQTYRFVKIFVVEFEDNFPSILTWLPQNDSYAMRFKYKLE